MKPDLRRIRIGIEVSGRVNWYENAGWNIKVTGTKYANPLQNECTVTIKGLSEMTRDFILTETSPFNSNKTPKKMFVEVGRQSTGLFRIFTGDITSADPGGPPDVDITLKSKTKSSKAKEVIAVSGPAITKLSGIAQRVADEVGVGLDFRATDKNIANFSFSGAALSLVNSLQEAGGVKAFVDDETLFVKDYAKALVGRTKVLSMNTGMVGIPKATEKGIDVTFQIDSESVLGGTLLLESKFNKSINGGYVIDQLKFEATSHDDQFWYTATCSRYDK